MSGEIDSTPAAISDAELAALLPALSEAERATSETTARFVPPRPGILEEVSARRHQLVYGRRGVGKSTLLQRVAAGGLDVERAVIFVDIALRRCLVGGPGAAFPRLDRRRHSDVTLVTGPRRGDAP